MNTEIPDTAQVKQIWSITEKITFRFFFLFLGLTSLLLYNVVAGIFNLISIPENVMGIFNESLDWIDRHFLHLGFLPGIHTSQFGDNYFGWIMWITLFIVSLLGTIGWSFVDHKRINYNALYYWFRFYLAYYIFQAMIMYAIRKIIPVQMPYPNLDSLLMPFGNQSKFEVLWNFIGVSPLYSMFIGSCELIGSLLILFPRTRVLGSLFMTTVLINVVFFNLLYNVPVKIGSIQLLLCTLFLLAPFIPKLIHFFYHLKPVSIAEKKYTFSTPWKKYLMRALVLIPVWLIFINVKSASEMLGETRMHQKLYDVNTFVLEKDTLPPLLTDSRRWKRITFVSIDDTQEDYVGILNMKDESLEEGYSCKWDSTKKTITVIFEDTVKNTILNYSEPSKNKLRMKGKWNGNNIDVLLDKFEIDSMNLVKEKIKWIQD